MLSLSDGRMYACVTSPLNKCHIITSHSSVSLSSLQTLSPDLLSKMAAALGQNKTMRFLVLNDSSGRQFGSDLTQYSTVKQFVKYLLLGVSRNSTLEEVKLQIFCLSGFIKREFMWCYSRLALLFSHILQ